MTNLSVEIPNRHEIICRMEHHLICRTTTRQYAHTRMLRIRYPVCSGMVFGMHITSATCCASFPPFSTRHITTLPAPYQVLILQFSILLYNMLGTYPLILPKDHVIHDRVNQPLAQQLIQYLLYFPESQVLKQLHCFHSSSGNTLFPPHGFPHAYRS